MDSRRRVPGTLFLLCLSCRKYSKSFDWIIIPCSKHWHRTGKKSSSRQLLRVRPSVLTRQECKNFHDCFQRLVVSPSHERLPCDRSLPTHSTRQGHSLAMYRFCMPELHQAGTSLAWMHCVLPVCPPGQFFKPNPPRSRGKPARQALKERLCASVYSAISPGPSFFSGACS